PGPAPRRRGAAHGEARHHGAPGAGRRAQGGGDGSLARPDAGGGGMNPTRRHAVPCYVVMCCAVMAGLAGAGGACEGGIKPTATIRAPDSAHPALITMSHEVTQSGVLRAEGRADTAHFYSSSQTADLPRAH